MRHANFVVRLRPWRTALGASLAALLLVGVAYPAGAAAATFDPPVPVTPYSGFAQTLTRAPYVTDLTQTTAYINWATNSSAPGSVAVQPAPDGVCPSSISTWTSSALKVTTSLPGQVNPVHAASSSSMTGWGFSVINGAGTSTSEFQASVPVTGLRAGSEYCYAVFSTASSGAVDLLPATQPYQLFTTLDPVGATSSLTFDVIADTGENWYYTKAGTPSLSWPNNVNPDQAAIYQQIGQSGARFLLDAGDIAYSGGTQSTYGDLQSTGTSSTSEVSNIFGPSYQPLTGGVPVFAAAGNHGQNVTTLRNWPTSVTATNSGGTYAFDSYDGSVDGISGNSPDAWYAFSSGNVRVYVLDGSWADGNFGSATGGLCSTPSACAGYQADADEHWQTTSPEYRWLAKDLSSHPGGVKFAVFHFPLRSDNVTQPSDPYLQNTSANPNAATSLEKLLSDNGVAMAFNGHTHNYQRITPNAPGTITNYVVGGGGGILEPVTGGSVCTTLRQQESLYAIGWTPSSTQVDAGSGTACGAAVPTSAADVYSFLKVNVTGNTVTVTPTNAAGNTFDVQTYTLDTPPPTDVMAPTVPTGLTASTSVTVGSIDLSWTASRDDFGVTGYDVYRDGQSAPIATVSSGTTYTDAGLANGSQHSYTVSAFDAAGNESAQSTSATGTAGSDLSGSVVTLSPAGDATISNASATLNTNYGRATNLIVDADQYINDSMLQFAVPSSCRPASATLTLTVDSAVNSNSGKGGSLYAAPGQWSESTVTGGNAPAAVGSPVTLGAVALSTSYTVDVSSLLSAALGGSSTASFRLKTTSTDAAMYVSKESTTNPGGAPKLAVTCAANDTTAPSVPTGVAATTASTAGAIDLTWSASTDNVGVAGYHVYRDGSGSPTATVSSGTSYTDTGMANGSSHNYTVSAFDAAGNESSQSASATANAGAGSSGQTVALTPTDDATLSKASATLNTNYGHATNLIVDADQYINDFMLQFSLPSACTPTTASLTLTVDSAVNSNSGAGGSIYAAPGQWSESAVTGADAPAAVGSPVKLGPVALSTAYTVDITSLLAAATTGSTVSLRATTTSTDGAMYASKESTTNPAGAPKLVVTCA